MRIELELLINVMSLQLEQSVKMKLLLVLLFASVYAKHEVYSGWKSFYVKSSSHEQLKALGNQIAKLELDFVTYPTINREGVVLVKPPYQTEFLKFLAEKNIEHSIHADDIKASLDQEDQMIESYMQVTRFANTDSIMSYDNYQPLEVIYRYLDSIAKKYSDIVTLVTEYSFETRPIKYLKISKDNFQSGKPVIFMDGGTHAREWITVPTVTYAIHKLVENATEPDLLDKFDWILMPIVNPDGYKYSFVTERMYRKNRSNDQHILSRMCPGVDINRNFDFEWNTVGTDPHPCTDIFPGRRAFSEVETRVVGGILKENIKNLIMYLSVHSAGSMFLYPWGNNGTLSNNGIALQTVGEKMANVINDKSLFYFPRYQVGNSAVVLDYATSGSSEDYAHALGVPFSYTVELPGLRRGINKFALHPRFIRQVITETWAGFTAGARLARELVGTK